MLLCTIHNVQCVQCVQCTMIGGSEKGVDMDWAVFGLNNDLGRAEKLDIEKLDFYNSN